MTAIVGPNGEVLGSLSAEEVARIEAIRSEPDPDRCEDLAVALFADMTLDGMDPFAKAIAKRRLLRDPEFRAVVRRGLPGATP